MIEQIVDNAGVINLIGFLGVSVAEATKIIEFAENWTAIMFAISGTAAAVYSILKIITWCRNNKKNKK